MAEYIRKEKLIQRLKVSPLFLNIKPSGSFICDGVIDIINKQSVADVVEVVHGHNKTSMHPVDEFWCSACGFCCADYTETKYDEDGDYTYSCECKFDYCPKCGAKMDGERRSENENT